MRRTRSYAKFLAFALAVSLAFQSAPAMAGKFNPDAEDNSGGITVGQAGTGAVYGTVPDGDTSSIAIGNGSTVQSNGEQDPDKQTADAIAVGTDAEASDKNATAIGTSATASGVSSTAIGTGAEASGPGTVVIGDGAQANGNYSIAIGHNAGAPTTGLNAIAIGTSTVATGESSVAIGYTANARGERSLALGDDAEAWGTNSVALGYGAESTLNANNSVAIGTSATASGVSSTAIGTGAVASGLSTVVIGDGVKASGHYSIAIGYNDGAGAQMTGRNAIAIGTNTAAIGMESVAIGYIANARGENSLALGNDAEALGKNSVALGYGAESTDAANNSVALGRNSLANEDNVVSIGNDGAKITRRLVNMAAGQADTDAVNVKQLNDTLGIFGNNTTVSNTDGTITKNGFTYRTNAQATVQDAFDAIDEDIEELDANAVRYAAGHANKLILTDSGSGVQISNVADGDVTETSTYAVNGSQLYSLAESIAGKLGVDYTGGTTFGNFSVDINGTTYDDVAAAIGALANGALADGWNINGADGTPGSGGTPGAGTGTGSGNVAPGGSLNVEAGSNIVVSVEDGAATGDADLNISVSNNPTFGSVTADSMEAGTITANDKVTVGTGDKQTVIDGTAGTVTVGKGDNQTKIDATNGTVTVGDSNSDTYTEIGSGNLQVNTDNGFVLANNTGLQVNNGNGNGDQVWIGYEGTVHIAKGNGNSVTLTNGTGEFTNANGTTSIDGQKGTFGSTGNQTVIDGGTVTVDNQITVGGADGTVINDGSVSIKNDSAYFRENSMKVGSMTYDGVSNTLNMGGAGRLTGLADGGVYMGSTDAVTGNQLWQAYKRMDQLQESINIVGAHAAALSGLHPIDYNPYEPTTLSAAIGTYRDEYAVAVGVFHYVRENVLFNLGASICSDGDLMGRAGISFTVGRGGDKKKALAPKDMNEVQAQLAEVRQALHELKAENAALKVRLDAKSK